MNYDDKETDFCAPQPSKFGFYTIYPLLTTAITICVLLDFNEIGE